jgi:hypothetical protein
VQGLSGALAHWDSALLARAREPELWAALLQLRVVLRQPASCGALAAAVARGVARVAAKLEARAGGAGAGGGAEGAAAEAEYYADADANASVPGLMHVTFGQYHVRDVKFVAASPGVAFDGTRGGRFLRFSDCGPEPAMQAAPARLAAWLGRTQG